MKTSIVFFLLAVEFSFSFEQKNSSENENPNNTSLSILSSNKEKTDIELQATGKKLNIRAGQRKPNYLITPDQKLIIDPRTHYEQFIGDGSAIPLFGFSNLENQRQNIYFSDDTGKYNLQLENFRQKKPSNFQAAVGAISAHIANQRNNQEYIPYPPNGDPYNYPAYRGHSHATEPPAIRAYERTTGPNYGVQPMDFEQQNPRRIFSSNDYETGFSSQFPNPGLSFYSEPDFYKSDGFHTQLKRNSEPVYKPQWYDLKREYRRSVN